MSTVSPERVNVSRLLDHNLEAGRADKPALLGEFGTLTFADVARLTARTAALLAELGVGREDRVMMVLDDSPVFHATFLGAIRIGAVPIPVNPMDRTDNYAYYLDDSYAKVLVVEAALLDKVEPALAGRPALPVLVANGDPRGHTSFDDAVASQPDELEPAADTHADDMAFWLYSSGSTGRPKGVVHTHRDIGATIDTYARHVLKITEDDLCYSTTKLFHAYGLGNGLSFPLSAGATTVLVRGPSKPDRILETVARHSPTLFFSVPALYAAMLKTPALAAHRLLEHPGLHLGGRAAVGRGVGALAGADRRADPRRDRLDRDAAHLLLQHARGPAAGNLGHAGARLRPARDRRARSGRSARRGGRPAGPRRELCRLLLAPAREDAALHARGVVLHRRPLRQDRPTVTSSTRAGPTT